jgi:hypothetical protein
MVRPDSTDISLHGIYHGSMQHTEMATHLLIPFLLYLYRSLGQLDGFALLECIYNLAVSTEDAVGVPLNSTIPGLGRRKSLLSLLKS